MFLLQRLISPWPANCTSVIFMWSGALVHWGSKWHRQRSWCSQSDPQVPGALCHQLWGLGSRKKTLWGPVRNLPWISTQALLHYNAAIEKQNQKGGRKKTRLTFWETKGNLNERRDYRTLSKMKYSLRLLENGVEAGLGGTPTPLPY